jgi:hypothetical protein
MRICNISLSASAFVNVHLTSEAPFQKGARSRSVLNAWHTDGSTFEDIFWEFKCMHRDYKASVPCFLQFIIPSLPVALILSYVK